MKTLMKLLFASAILLGCSKDDTANKLVRFTVISSTTMRPIPNSVLEIRETISINSRLLDSVRANSFGEIVVPKKYELNYGNINAPGYKTYPGILLNVTPNSKNYQIEPLFWLKVHLKIQSDSIANFLFSPWGTWYNLQTNVDTIFTPFSYQVRFPETISYRYSLKSNPTIYVDKVLSFPIVERDTTVVSLNL